jgi:hypothetical protein
MRFFQIPSPDHNFIKGFNDSLSVNVQEIKYREIASAM